MGSLRLARALGLAALSVLALHSWPRTAAAQARPMIEHISPTAGPPGTRVHIVGRGFRPIARVLFNEHEVPILERLPEQLTVQVPANAQSGRFVVAHGDDEVESDVFRVTEAPPPPHVTAIDPTSAGPGSEVVIRGANFGASPEDNQVRIGNLPMVVRSTDPTNLHVIVPEGAATGPMTVHTAGGDVQTPPLTVAARVVVRDFTPPGAAPGSHVTVHGSGFSPTPQNNHVAIGPRPVRVVRATADTLEIEVPRDAQQGGPIVVEVPGSGRFETGSALRVAPAPNIASVTPPQGAAGTRVTLHGERFGIDPSAVQATLGNTPANVITVGPSDVVVTVPRGATTGRWNVTVGGIGPVQSPSDFAVLEPVSVTAFNPRAGDAGDHITLSGTGFSPTAAQNTVHLGLAPARVISATQRELIVEVPPARSGQWVVAVEGNGEARSHDPFMITVRPRINALEPDSGIVGDRVTLRGENFPSDAALVQVRLQDVECMVESTSRDAIVVRVPNGVQPGPANFSVIARLQGTGHAAMPFHVLVPVQITGFDPPAAPVRAHVTLRGSGFETDVHNLHVRFGTTVLHPTNVTATSMDIVVPANATSADVTVEAPQRQTATRPFRVQVPPVLQSFAPASGAAGTAVTLRGRNFGTDASAVAVTLGTANCAVTNVTPTSVTATVPAGAATGRFTLHVNDQGDATAPRDFRVTGAPASPAPPHH